MGKESQTRAKVQCMRGTDNQNVCPPIMGCYTHWTFWTGLDWTFTPPARLSSLHCMLYVTFCLCTWGA